MELEAILKGEGIEKSLQEVGLDFSIEKDSWYHRLIFPLKDKKEIDHILKTLISHLSEHIEILNTSLIYEQDHLELPHGYKVMFVHPGESPSIREKEIVLKRGLAFGGYHPTTVMCMELLIDIFREHDDLKNVLDLGTGSGILAIMAKKLGAGQVCAVDLDFQSCTEARYNVMLNDSDGVIKIICGNEDCIKANFDFIMVNIIFHTLERLILDLKSRLTHNGYLIISGFLSADQEKFANLLGKNGVLSTKEKEGWGAILWQKE